MSTSAWAGTCSHLTRFARGRKAKGPRGLPALPLEAKDIGVIAGDPTEEVFSIVPASAHLSIGKMMLPLNSTLGLNPGSSATVQLQSCIASIPSACRGCAERMKTAWT